MVGAGSACSGNMSGERAGRKTLEHAGWAKQGVEARRVASTSGG